MPGMHASATTALQPGALESGNLKEAPQSERVARLRLIRSKNVGPRTYSHLMRRFGTASYALCLLYTSDAADE